MKNREVLKKEIIAKFYTGNEDLNGLSNSEILNYLKDYDTDTYKVVNDFLVILDAYFFTKTDMDLKLKADDIWRQQMDMFKTLIQERKTSLLSLAESKSIEIEEIIEELKI